MNTVDFILPMWQRYWTLPAELDVWQWAEEHVRLLSLPTPRPGAYSTGLTPYVREPLECWRNPDVRDVSMCWGSQTGKTTCLMVGLCWQVVNEPGPMLWVFPNASLAKTFSEERMQKIVRDTPATAILLPSDPRKVQQMKIPLARALLLLTGSNSPANLSSNPVRTAIMDEVDKLAEQSAKEANAIDLTEQRTKSYWLSRKVWKTSTPTLPDAPIWEHYLNGDQRRFFLKCPSCRGDMLPILSKTATSLPVVGCEAELEWEDARLRGGDRDWGKIESSTRLVCPHCEARLAEPDKPRLLRSGEWRPTATPVNSWRRSYHLSTLYSPDVPWGELVVQFLRAKESLEGLQGFINGALAEPWMHQDDRPDRREQIVAEASSESGIRVVTADLQAAPPSWWVCREWFKGGHSRLVEWGEWDSFDQLEEHRQRLGAKADLTGCDSGYEGAEVYRECARLGWFALRGDDAADWPHKDKARRPWVERRFDPYLGSAKAGRRKIVELRWSNPTIKDILSRLRDGERSPVRWEIPEKFATEEYFRHLDGEYRAKEYNPKTGRTVYRWKQRGRRWPNHLFDCECMQVAVAIRLNILKTK